MYKLRCLRIYLCDKWTNKYLTNAWKEHDVRNDGMAWVRGDCKRIKSKASCRRTYGNLLQGYADKTEH